MWRKIVPYVFIFSVALNLAFLGVWGVGALHGEADSGLEPCQGCSQESQLHRLIDTTDKSITGRSSLDLRWTEYVVPQASEGSQRAT